MKKSAIDAIHQGVLGYATAYTKLASSSSKISQLDASFMREIFEKNCDAVLCTYTCDAYVDDSKIKNCNVLDMGATYYELVMKKYCPSGKAAFSNAKMVEQNLAPFCNSKERTETHAFKLCYAAAAVNTVKQYDVFNLRNRFQSKQQAGLQV